MRPQFRSYAALSITLIALSGWSPALAKKGIIELGVAGQTAGGSTFRVIIDGQPFDPNSHIVTEPVESIRDKIIAKINASGVYTASASDPNNTTAITIVTAGSGLNTLEVFIDDPNIGNTFVDNSDAPGLSATVFGANAVAGDGNFELDLTVVCNGMPTTVYTQVVATGGKTRDQVNAAMVAALTGSGFSVLGPMNGPWVISHPLGRIQKAEMKRTDTAIDLSRVKLDSTAPAGTAGGIPTLSEWGLIALMVLLAGVAATRLRRRVGRAI